MTHFRSGNTKTFLLDYVECLDSEYDTVISSEGYWRLLNRGMML